jgi:5-methylcytosine-specific restriction endonuclease McrBC GTP-binding regulatory subunit McrB
LQTLQQEISVRDKIYDFVQKSIDENTEFETQGTKNKFHIIDSKPKSIVVEIPNNEKTKVISLQKSDLITLLENNVQISSGGDIQIYFQRKYRTQQDSYIFALYNILKDTKNEVKQVSLVERKNFVFIIDEINRGEISKIFGELFFSIDPGYRGKKGKVQTQYANMETEPNDFDDALGETERFGHFFVPENVYIIGTMNDIDRSVESMDFAFRRRFAFKEIKADENVGMLENLTQKVEAINRMKKLNSAIEKVDGLSSAYHIGASYFLKLNDYNGDFNKLWEYHLEGLLREYLRGTQDVDKEIEKLKTAYNDESDHNNGQPQQAN